MSHANKKIFLPLILVFIMLNGLIITFKTFLQNKGFDGDFIIIANLFFFVLSLTSLFIQRRGLQSDNTNAFIRGVYGAILFKLFLSIIVVTTYAFIKKSSINKPSLFFSMGLYIVYTSLEVAALMKAAKEKSNATKRITS